MSSEFKEDLARTFGFSGGLSIFFDFTISDLLYLNFQTIHFKIKLLPYKDEGEINC